MVSSMAASTDNCELVAAERIKVGSFEGFAVVIDGQPEKINLSRVGDKLDLRIAANAGGLSAGLRPHLTESDYPGAQA